MEVFCGLVDYRTGDWFQIISIYICINCLNNFLLNDKVRVGAGPESRFRELEVVKPDVLIALLP